MSSADDQQSKVDGPPLLCSECFQDIGIRLDAGRFGMKADGPCPACGSLKGALLDQGRIRWVAHRFFVLGSFAKTNYGGAPRVEFNDRRQNEVEFAGALRDDAELICKAAGIGFFYYGPGLWRLGHITPLEDLQDDAKRAPIVSRIISEYPEFILGKGAPFFRLRKGVGQPFATEEFDSPPDEYCGAGRLDLEDFPVLYGSPDLELCIHECRVTVEDLLHVATLEAAMPLRLLDLTAVLREDCTDFESLDMAVHMLFLSGGHSYSISRAISVAARDAGFDGIIFPSYFSLLKTGAPYLESMYGMSVRSLPKAELHEAKKIVPNIGIFGRPVAERRVRVTCINRVYLRQAAYDLGFGPADV